MCSSRPSAFIETITFSSNQSIKLSEADKVIIVGPNNCGKSQSLRDIQSLTGNPETNTAVTVKNVVISKSGTAEEFRDYYIKHGRVINQSCRYGDWSFHLDNCFHGWSRKNLPLGLIGGFLKLIDANGRLEICNQQASVSPEEERSKPQQILYYDSDLMKKTSSLFRKAFFKDLMINYLGGSVIPIHVGDLPSIDNPDRVSLDYVAAVKENPLLHNQGDGIKSYAGILFETIVSERNITLLDEPEAFLHPPQMRRLGETLANEISNQLIVATHSSDVLRGFLEATRGSLRILRLQREKDVNTVFEASPDTIRELWSTPKLRYSNALEGIFHEQTIICEDDGDCRLYQAIDDHLTQTGVASSIDLHFVPAGGKSGIPAIASVLRKIGVPVKAIFDIDILSNKDDVRSAYEAFGGEWVNLEANWNRLNMAVTSGVTPKTAKEIKQAIKNIIDTSDADSIPRGKIVDAMKQSSSWGIVKKAGGRGIPRGNAQKEFSNVVSKLEMVGIFVVPVGEIENFIPEIGGHGPKFINEVLESVPLDDARLEDLRQFVQKVHSG